MSTPVLGERIDALTTRGELYRPLGEGKLECHACGHRCVIFPGRRGICKVRYNQDGVLRVPCGYVAALACDPTEKKPFYHVLPGSRTLTFGMLGCDFHCPYCLVGDTMVISDRGPIPLAQAFELANSVLQLGDAEVAHPRGFRAVTGSGSLHGVRAIFRHRYRGPLVAIQPHYLPKLQCTPEHRVYATSDPKRPPTLVEASSLRIGDFLAIPRRYSFSAPQVIDTFAALQDHLVTHRVHWKLSKQDRDFVIMSSARGLTSQQIGAVLGKSGSYIRHVKRKITQGTPTDLRVRGPVIDGMHIRFPHERPPSIPRAIPLDEGMARLLGLYCAEGSAIRDRNRPNSFSVAFSFAPSEQNLAEEVRTLLRRHLGVRAAIGRRQSTLIVSASKTSPALVLQSLAGRRATEKRVPALLYNAPRSVVLAFLDGLVDGDGFRYPNGKVSLTTVSPDLAYGTGWLVLKLGFLPSIYVHNPAPQGQILGRTVRRAPRQFTVVWYSRRLTRRRVVETPEYFLVPIRQIASVDFDGFVYNMEVSAEHNFLAGFFLVSNCQNWLTSQALRDPAAGVVPEEVTPALLVDLARQQDAAMVGSSYNEPLITSEWAVAVFREARASGLRTCFVSNGNATTEVLDFLRPWTDCYKVDLKAMNARNYRALGGQLEHVLDTIRMVYERGYWLEVVTLVIPGWNDSEEELRAAARFIASLSPLIPWHVTAFHKDYRMTDPANTTAETLITAAQIGEAEGLKYVYAGNLPGLVGRYEHTWCHRCGELLIERFGFLVLQNRISPTTGCCPRCGGTIPGIWI